MNTILESKIEMTSDIQEFLHAMHDGHEVADEKQSLRNGTPETGKVVIFDSEAVHEVLPFEGDKPRLTVAFDLIRLKK